MSDKPSDAPHALERAEYQRIRELYIDGQQRNRQTLDKLLTAGASGALVLSVAFIEKIAPKPQAGTSWMLLAGWISLLISLAVSLLSYETASRGFDRAIQQLDERQTEGALGTDHLVNRWDDATEWLNRVTIASFFVGILLLVLFAYCNVPFERGPHA
jgi:hypothetical protein